MSDVYIIGNWKSNKNIQQTNEWLDGWRIKQQGNRFPDHVHIAICIPFTLLYFVKHRLELEQPHIVLGAQNVSAFEEGAYTGEVSASQLKEFVKYIIIGHSERRKYFGETDEILQQKVDQSKKLGLQVIYCVQDEQTPVAKGTDIVAYEPIWAIGTGKTDTPDNANGVLEKIKRTSGVAIGIYGGSVKPENVASFITKSAIDGVLPGGASLDPNTFFELVTRASAG